MIQIPGKVCLIILLAATIGDLLIPTILGMKYPGYSNLYDTISSLGTNKSPVQKYQCLNLIMVGLLFLFFTVGQYQAFETIQWSHVLYILGILIFGIGTIIAGFFPEDPLGTAETVSGKIHGIASGIGFLLLILNPLWSIWIKEFHTSSHIHVVVFILAVLTFLLFIMSENNTVGIFKYTGLLQRLNLVILYGYMIYNYIISNKYH